MTTIFGGSGGGGGGGGAEGCDYIMRANLIF